MKLTNHAKLRCAQRAVSAAQAEYVLENGIRMRLKDGRRAFHFGHREATHRLSLCETVPRGVFGLVVIVADDDKVITVYRTTNRHRLKKQGSPWRRTGTGRHSRQPGASQRWRG